MLFCGSRKLVGLRLNFEPGCMQIFSMLSVNLGLPLPLSMYNVSRVEASKTDHLRDYAPNQEKYEAVQIFPIKRIEIWTIAIVLAIVFLELKLL